MNISIFLVSLILLMMTLIFSKFPVTDGVGCNPRYFNYSSFVCVCDDVHCDSIESLPKLSADQYAVYTSSKTKYRLSLSVGKFIRDTKNAADGCGNNIFNSVCVNPNEKFQTIIGFGGSFTDASGINIYNLSPGAQENLMRAYFAEDGLNYNMGRVPIGGCDFSTRPYTYDDDFEGDFNLTHFKLQNEDFNYKIPLIKKAMAIRGGPLKMFASAWSAPAWMKSNGAINGFGVLKGDVAGLYYDTWAKYHLKFFQEYKQNGIEFFAMTAQNEPVDGLIPFFPFNAMGFLPSMQAAFVNQNLGPTLAKEGFGDIKIFVLDDNRPLLLPWMATVMSDPLSEKYVSGAALHWYYDEYAPAEVIDITHHLYPNQLLVMTEVSFIHTDFFQPPVKLGDWDRGEEYAFYVIQNLNHWVMGWIDWNLALDAFGKPNWADFNTEGTIIVDKNLNQFYKQPQYYAIGHFSKFVPSGSIRIDSKVSLGGSLFSKLSSIAFVTPEAKIVIVVLNKSSRDVTTHISIANVGIIASAVIPQRSIQTYVINL